MGLDHLIHGTDRDTITRTKFYSHKRTAFSDQTHQNRRKLNPERGGFWGPLQRLNGGRMGEHIDLYGIHGTSQSGMRSIKAQGMILTELVPKNLIFFREAFETHSMTVFKNQIKKFWLTQKNDSQPKRSVY